MIVITYGLSGRLGNNILQFWAGYFLSKMTDGLLLPPPNVGKNPTIVNDNDWDDIMHYFPNTEEQLRTKFDGQNVSLQGYFQRGNVYLRHPEWILETMKMDFQFVQGLQMKQLFMDVEIPAEVVVVHLRLSDFNYQGTSNIVDPDFYVNELQTAVSSPHNKTKVLFVVDQIKLAGEHKYLQTLQTKLQAVNFTAPIQLHSGNVLQDWNMLRCASYVISSNSTFAFTACVYGLLHGSDTGSKVVVYPQTHFYPQQTFDITLDGWRNVDVQRVNFDSL